MFNSYYDGQNHKPYNMIQSGVISRLIQDWTEYTIDPCIKNPVWNFDTFARYEILDQDLNPLAGDMELYYCTFSADSSRHGYFVLSYEADDVTGGSIKNDQEGYGYESRLYWFWRSGFLYLSGLKDIGFTEITAFDTFWQTEPRRLIIGEQAEKAGGILKDLPGAVVDQMDVVFAEMPSKFGVDMCKSVPFTIELRNRQRSQPCLFRFYC